MIWIVCTVNHLSHPSTPSGTRSSSPSPTARSVSRASSLAGTRLSFWLGCFFLWWSSSSSASLHNRGACLCKTNHASVAARPSRADHAPGSGLGGAILLWHFNTQPGHPATNSQGQLFQAFHHPQGSPAGNPHWV